MTTTRRLDDRGRWKTGARILTGGLIVTLLLASGGPASAGTGMVALQSADGSCATGGTDFYASCGNGTVTDNRSGLVWLANANCFGQLSWHDAMAVVAGLGDLSAQACSGMSADECDCGLSDGSAPGEWRLPSMAEWKTMISVGWDSDSCSPAIANDVGNGCWSQACFDVSACSFYGVQAAEYWSASAYVSQPAAAWLGDLDSGGVDLLDRASAAFVWPVRGGQ